MGSQSIVVDSQIDSKTCRCIKMDTKTGEFTVSYDGPQFICAVTDMLYIGHTGRRKNEPIIQRIVHGMKKVYKKYLKQGICYFITISSENTSEATINIIVDNQHNYSDEELQLIREEFMDDMYATYDEFFQGCNEGIDLVIAEQNAYDFMLKRVTDRLETGTIKGKTAKNTDSQDSEARGGFIPDPTVVSIISDELSKNTMNASMSEKAKILQAAVTPLANLGQG